MTERQESANCSGMQKAEAVLGLPAPDPDAGRAGMQCRKEADLSCSLPWDPRGAQAPATPYWLAWVHVCRYQGRTGGVKQSRLRKPTL